MADPLDMLSTDRPLPSVPPPTPDPTAADRNLRCEALRAAARVHEGTGQRVDTIRTASSILTWLRTGEAP